jgi:hypothetical protein
MFGISDLQLLRGHGNEDGPMRRKMMNQKREGVTSGLLKATRADVDIKDEKGRQEKEM